MFPFKALHRSHRGSVSNIPETGTSRFPGPLGTRTFALRFWTSAPSDGRTADQADLTAQQYNALRLLKAAYPQPLPTLALASRLISLAPDITRLLDKLHQRKLVERTRPADNRRTVMISITPAGLALLSKLAD